MFDGSFDGAFLLRIVAAGFAAVGLEEYLKNFIKVSNSKWYALLMLPIAVGCFFAAEKLPAVVLGSILTIGSVQLCYETLIQGFRALIERLSRKAGGDRFDDNRRDDVRREENRHGGDWR